MKVGLKEIPLTRGQVAVVDDVDFERVMARSWYYRPPQNRSRSAYAYSGGQHGEPHNIALHRFILGVTDSATHVDHIDGNGLNNTRGNLRVCSRQQNTRNVPTHKDNQSGFKGVSFDKPKSRWSARICLNYRQRFLGAFRLPEDAARAYDKAAREHFGEFARLNFPTEAQL